MKLSEATHLRFQRLFRSRFGQGEQGVRLTEQQEVAEINAIGDACESAAVPALSGLLADPRELVSTAAVMALAQIMERCGPTTLAQLDAMVREVSEWRWSRVKVTELPQIALGLTNVLGVLSFNSSGYVRGAAVRVLADIHDGQELPFLLIRLNDWVQQVRDAAYEAVIGRVSAAYVPHLVRCLPLIFRLKEQIRKPHGVMLASIHGLLCQPESQSSLHKALSAADSQTRRLAFRVLVDVPSVNPQQAMETALASSDPMLRFLAAHELRTRLEGRALQAVLERLKTDRLMTVRREALYGFVEKLPGGAPEVLNQFLLDPHPSMREAARFYLQRLGTEEFASFYRNLLGIASGQWLATTVAGLGETGNAQDCLRLVTFIAHPQARVRRATVRALGRLDAESYTNELLTALQDPSVKVTNVASKVLESRIRLFPPERLWSIFEQAGHPHTCQIALTLIAQLGWWDSAWMLITAADTTETLIRKWALGHLRNWQSDPNRLVIRPHRKQVEAIEDALRVHGATLDADVRRDLESILLYTRTNLL